jgi:sugar phosphate isomerase/epimerase
MIVGGRFHLTYCSNIHAGEAWSDVRDALASTLPRLRESLQAPGPMGVGLRLGAEAAGTLADADELAAFRAFLAEGHYYVFTINGFPYGAFHGRRVKEQVYQPDWRTDARLAYTNRLAELLAALLEDRPDIDGSVSTVPGAFKADVRGDGDASAVASNMLRHVARLVALRLETGRTITLAIEPEPACFIETIDEAVAFFRDYLFDDRRATAAGVRVDDVRRHVGLCFDACHMAVEFEDPEQAFERIQSAGIRVCKVQVSSALHIAHPRRPGPRAALARFADDTYLHQVVTSGTDGLARFTDLPDALAAPEAASDCWRVHFHVPVFLPVVGEFETTQSYLSAVLRILAREPICPYLEVETYTWDVLPPEHRTSDMVTAIARELAWVKAQVER